MKSKGSISRRIVTLVVVSIVLVGICASLGGAVLLGSKMMHDKEDYLRLSTYAIIKETALMSADNTKMEVVNELLMDFKKQNESDVTIFEYDIRVFSTVPNAVGTKMDSGIWKALQSGESYFSKDANVNGEKYYAWYEPVMKDGKCVGAIFAGQPASNVDDAIIQAMINVFVIALICGCIVVTVAMKIARRMAKKLRQLETVIKTLTANDLSVEFPKYEKLHDEIDEISNETANFTAQLRGIISRIIGASHSLNTVSDELTDGMGIAYQSTGEIAIASDQIAKGVENQSQDTQNITQQIEEIGNLIDTIRDSMAFLTDTSVRMTQVKENTLINVEKAEHENDTIRAGIEEVNTQIDATSKSMKEISGFVDVIKDIADQTNLLSLNASIESAHAGEHGRGFAVVAEEIRKLAEQSAKSAIEIEKTIELLNENYSHIIKKMEVTTENVEIQSDQIEQTRSAFGLLDSDIKDTVGQISDVAKATETLETMKNRIIDSVCSLSAICQENSASTEETTAGMQELNAIISQATENANRVKEKAKALMDDVSVFKV